MKKIVSIGVVWLLLSKIVIGEIFYASAGLGLESSSDGRVTNGMNFILNGGVFFDKIIPNLALLGEGSYTLIPLSGNDGIGKNKNFTILNIGAYVGYRIKLRHTNIHVIPHIGVNYQKISDNIYNSNRTDGAEALSYGISGYFPLTNNLNVRLDIADKGDSNNMSIGVEFLF